MKLKRLTHFTKGAVLVIGAAIPLLIAAEPARSFLANHPADAAYLPLAAGLATLVYKWAKRGD